MITCAANGCPSIQATKIDGKPISFFAFPEGDLRKNQWIHNCNLASGIAASDKESLYLCELHFERNDFTASKDLKSTAVPTLFGRIEEPSRKHKGDNILQVTKTPPLKQKKLDEQQHTLVTLPQRQSPFIQLINNVEDSVGGNKPAVSTENAVTINGSVASSSVTHENRETNPNQKMYRLMIQIDKIRGKPGPRCKKQVPLMLKTNDTKDSATGERKIREKTRLSPKPVKQACINGSCKLKRCVQESKPAFQCETCKKYYFIKKDEGPEEKDNTICTICSTTFPNPQALYIHIKKHFICDICQTECNSQVMHDKHVRLHVSTDPSYPYKCHQCAKIFELKESVKQHCLTEHPKIKLQKTLVQITSATTNVSRHGGHRCASCNITFRYEQAYKNHMNSHKKKEDLRCNISETNNIFPVSNPLTGGQIGILQPVKFSCNVCSMEFDNVGEVDVHTRTHLEDTEEDHKCNICKKLFKSSMAFSDHLKHHLSRAHPCPICSKAFINRTTLKIHLKTHSDS